MLVNSVNDKVYTIVSLELLIGQLCTQVGRLSVQLRFQDKRLNGRRKFVWIGIRKRVMMLFPILHNKFETFLVARAVSPRRTFGIPGTPGAGRQEIGQNWAHNC